MSIWVHELFQFNTAASANLYIDEYGTEFSSGAAHARRCERSASDVPAEVDRLASAPGQSPRRVDRQSWIRARSNGIRRERSVLAARPQGRFDAGAFPR